MPSDPDPDDDLPEPPDLDGCDVDFTVDPSDDADLPEPEESA